ncbi:hypothetical protein K3495_g13894 [Podosphaera aphanis]|nr:hypothetical protein K3495_g13894 [Podosphaera aphanis]
MTDGKKANIIHYSSVECKRVTRSVLASELYVLVLGFDAGAVIKSTIQQILQKEVPLVLCTDSRSLYEYLVKLGATTEKRLMVDIMCIRQLYERRKITQIIWIDGDSNPADAMTKHKLCNVLRQLIDINNLDIKVLNWVDRQNPDFCTENAGLAITREG